MTLRQLASKIAKAEGKKSQVAIGNIREILKALINIEAELIVNGEDAKGGALYLLATEIEKLAAKKAKKK
jgi:hypothetical protein